MNIADHYRFLQVEQTASEEELSASFKKLAIKYHPDKNRGNLAWANEAMTRLNISYSAIISHRFKNGIPEEKPEPRREERKSYTEELYEKRNREQEREDLIERFAGIRESSKDALYQYNQFSLYNMHLRETAQARSKFKTIVNSLRRSYHSINSLEASTKDPELIEHFTVFRNMIFEFYLASECINVLDSYGNSREVEAFRYYRRGDEHLNLAQKEMFFDRHNRGFFKREYAEEMLAKSVAILEKTYDYYHDTGWAVETKIKLDFALALRKYLHLFFSRVG